MEAINTITPIIEDTTKPLSTRLAALDLANELIVGPGMMAKATEEDLQDWMNNDAGKTLDPEDRCLQCGNRNRLCRC